ncbi:MAG: hypothetical protein ACK4KT_05435 [Thermaurantimonas sp.]
MQRIKEIVENLNGIHPEDADLLKQLAAQYPYASIIQLIYTYILNKQENYNFNAQLKLAAATINSRTKLFSIIHGGHNIQVSKYHDEPVYVQTSDKIDDLPQSSINKTNTFNELSSNKIIQLNELNTNREPDQAKPDQSLTFVKIERAIDTENLITAEDTPTNSINSEKYTNTQDKIDIQTEEKNEDDPTTSAQLNEVITPTPEIESKDETDIQKGPKVVEYQPNVDTIRLKIKERFGERTEQSHASENESPSQPSVKDRPSEKSIESGDLKSEDNKDFQQKTIEKSGEAPGKKTPLPTIEANKPEEKNEELDAIRKRASKILENLNKLKIKYGTELIKDHTSSSDPQSLETNISESNIKQSVPASFIDNAVTKNPEEKKSEKVTAENPVINKGAQTHNVEVEEANVEFDLTNDDGISDFETGLERTASIVATHDDEDYTAAPDKVTEWILEDPEKTDIPPVGLEETASNELTEVGLDHLLKDDVFEKWMSKLSSSKDSGHQPTKSLSKNIENETQNNLIEQQSKKTEKLKIIDNFLSGNIQIKPKSNRNTDKENQDLSERYIETSPDLMTETLAELYLIQGHIDKAIQAYEILKLKNPEKSTFFARKIQDIKKKK